MTISQTRLYNESLRHMSNEEESNDQPSEKLPAKGQKQAKKKKLVDSEDSLLVVLKMAPLL